MRREVLTQLRRDLAAKRAVVLATDLGTGDGRLLYPFEKGEQGAADEALLAAAREAAERDESATVATPGGEVFLRVFNPPLRLFIVGAVHIAQALGRMAQLADYDVLVLDPRRSFASQERFQGVPLSTDWPDEAMGRLGLDRRSAVVTMTHDPKIDDPALAAALRSKAFYVGALGSRKTQAARRERLREMGFSDADISRIHGPVGLSIGAVSTGEIAASILAELVGCLRQPQEPARK
jgi:xanthine dehydrogenase accessory factor